MSALREDVACRLCRLEDDRERHEQGLEDALEKVKIIQDILRAIAHERATYRVEVQRATNGGGFSPEYVAMMNDTLGGN
jgi:hypothetical protein